LQKVPIPYRPAGIRRLAYWCGRLLEGVGLILIWWVLLLFAGVADMWILLYWSLAAVLVFYTGWACTTWAKKGGQAHRFDAKGMQG
jgi:hypothetical protein